MRYFGLVFLWMIVVVSYPAQANEATITTCDFNSYRSAMTTLNRGGGTLTIDCSGVITVPTHQVIQHQVTITAMGDVIFDGEGRSLHFVVLEDATLTLINLRLKNGYDVIAGGAIVNYGGLITENVIFESNFAPGAGGAIYNFGDVTIQNSKFLDNAVDAERQLTGGGGAILNTQSGVMTISDSTFVNNRASTGGAIFNANQMTISNSTFLDNTAEVGSGGAIYQWRATSRLTIEDSFFAGNRAKYGAVIYNQEGFLQLNDSQLVRNNARAEAGAIFNNAMGDIQIEQVLFQDNFAPIGGAISNFRGEIVIMQTTFSGNRTANQGGAIYNNDTVTISNSTFYQNHANDRGGAIYNFGQNTDVRILHSTFADNTATVGFGTLYNYGTMTSTYSVFSGGDNQCGGLSLIDADATNLASSACADATLVDDLMLGEFDGMLIPLLLNSPASDAYDAPCEVEIDQIGTTRPQGDACDLGAVEMTD